MNKLNWKLLHDKVVLLLSFDATSGRSLAVALAAYGADIAFVFGSKFVDRADKAKKRIEAVGGSCLLIPVDGIERAISQEVVQKTLDSFGGIDIFIDYWSPHSQLRLATANQGQHADNGNRAKPFVTIDILSAVLNQMVDSDEEDFRDEKEDERSVNDMRIGQKMINKPIFSIKEGREIGKVQDFYLDEDLQRLQAIYLGGEGLLSRTKRFVSWDNVVTMGEDAILVEDADCVGETADGLESTTYFRRDDLKGRPVDTPGGTKIGLIGDVIVDDEAKIVGFSLTQIYVSGPVAENRAISRAALIETGSEDGKMTANLADAEEADLQISYEGLFAEPAVSPTETS